MEKKAILYVENSDHILELAQFLVTDGWTIISGGATGEILRKHNIEYQAERLFDEIGKIGTGLSNMLQSVLKTTIDTESSESFKSKDLEHNLFLVCVNLTPHIYAYDDVFGRMEFGSDVTYLVSGLIRASISNYKNVLLLTDPLDYKEAMIQIRTDSVALDFRLYLAGKAFAMSSAYDAGMGHSILKNSPYGVEYSKFLCMPHIKSTDLHYGTNTQQSAAVYFSDPEYGSYSGFKKVQGREMTHKILTDCSVAWDSISILYAILKKQFSVKSENCDGYPFTTQFTPLTGTVYTVMIKYKTLFGASLDTSVLSSFKKTLSYDKDTMDHATLGCSAVIDEVAAKEIIMYSFSAVIAPGFTDEAKAVFAENPAIRLIQATKPSSTSYNITYLDGGLIIQSLDNKLFEKWIVPTKNRPSQKLIDELAFGMIMVMSAPSYASICIKDNSVVGISGGFGSRIKSLENVLYESKQTFKTNETVDGVIADVLVCDSPIQLCEPIKELIDRGVSAIIQTGGTPNDKEFIDYCDQRGVAMVFTGLTHQSY